MIIPDRDFAISEMDGDPSERSLLPGPLNAVDFLGPQRVRSVYSKQNHYRLSPEEWFALCAWHGGERLHDCVSIDPEVRGGLPVLKGTRFTAAEALAELAECGHIEDVAKNFDLEGDSIRDLLNGLSLILNRPYPK